MPKIKKVKRIGEWHPSSQQVGVGGGDGKESKLEYEREYLI